VLRILSTRVADGPTHMALDEALLESAAETTLRCYRWQPTTLSLGYFQDHPTVRGSLPGPMPMVRRITGGGAIWHEHEVTYALVGRLGRDGLPGRARDCYPLLHAAVARALSAHAAVELQEATVGDRRYREQPRCFASPAAADVVAADGGKILGSAARTRGPRVLVHGSLKLASNPWDGPAVAGCGLDATAAARLLQAAITAALGVTAEAGELTAAEHASCERIREQRYGDPGWVERREGPPA